MCVCETEKRERERKGRGERERVKKRGREGEVGEGGKEGRRGEKGRDERGMGEREPRNIQLNLLMSLFSKDAPQEVEGHTEDGQYDHPVSEQQPEALKLTKLH